MICPRVSAISRSRRDAVATLVIIVSIKQEICDFVDNLLGFDLSDNIENGKDFITVSADVEKTECS